MNNQRQYVPNDYQKQFYDQQKLNELQNNQVMPSNYQPPNQNQFEMKDLNQDFKNQENFSLNNQNQIQINQQNSLITSNDNNYTYQTNVNQKKDQISQNFIEKPDENLSVTEKIKHYFFTFLEFIKIWYYNQEEDTQKKIKCIFYTRHCFNLVRNFCTTINFFMIYYLFFMNIQDQILEKIKFSKNGVELSSLKTNFSLDNKELQKTLQELYSLNLISIEQKNNQLHFFYQNPEQYKKVKDLTNEEKIVFQLISDKQTNGAWSVELKNKSNLQPNQLNKILNNLEKKQLIKSFKPINFKNRKMWILFELQAHEEMTGQLFNLRGFFYQNNEIDQQKVDDLCFKTFQYIISHKLVNKSEISIHLRSFQDLQDSHIQNILDVLIYDDRIEEVANEINPKNPSYQVSQWNKIITDTNLTNVPCGVCPLKTICQKGNTISPENCIYLLKW